MKAIVATLPLLLWVSPARADDPAPEPASPWSQGVSQQRQDRANELAQEANQRFGEGKHAEALRLYQEALAQWDHPSIRLNIAVTLIRLDRYLEAGEALDAALRYGAAPFPSDKYEQAIDYKKLVDHQLGTIAVDCSQAQTSIVLDGKSWFTCPGNKTQRVLAGEHVIVAEAAGYMTESRRVVVSGDATANVSMSLKPIESATRLVYPTRRWIPWTVAIGGATIALAGLPIWYAGRRQMDRADAQFKQECMSGCDVDLSEHASLQDSYDSARFKGGAGITMMIAGGATAIGGLVWALFLNEPARVLEVRPTDGGLTISTAWRL